MKKLLICLILLLISPIYSQAAPDPFLTLSGSRLQALSGDNLDALSYTIFAFTPIMRDLLDNNIFLFQ